MIWIRTVHFLLLWASVKEKRTQIEMSADVAFLGTYYILELSIYIITMSHNAYSLHVS